MEQIMEQAQDPTEFDVDDEVCLVHDHSQRGVVEEVLDDGGLKVRWDNDDGLYDADPDDVERV